MYRKLIARQLSRISPLCNLEALRVEHVELRELGNEIDQSFTFISAEEILYIPRAQCTSFHKTFLVKTLEVLAYFFSGLS